MGQLVKNTTFDYNTINAVNLTANGSPVLSVANSTFDNVIYVAVNGNDLNDGRSLATPKRTIQSAMSIAAGGYAVKVASGTYVENCPIQIPAGVALVGDDVRSVFVKPYDRSSDVFYMRGGSYVWGITIKDYDGRGFSFPPSGIAEAFSISPYIQNITSMTTSNTAITVEIDGNLCLNPVSTRGFILGFITSINQGNATVNGGTGLRMLNRAYSQAVNIYSIACNVGVKLESGSFISLIGSDNGIGNYGLIAEGGDLQFTGNILGNVVVGDVSINIANMSSPPRTNNGILIGNDPNMYFIGTFSNVSAEYPGYGNVWNVNITSRFGATTGNIAANSTAVSGWQVSTISAASHTFEYVGAGANPATALPQYGGIPKPENEVIERSITYPTYGNVSVAGRVNWTSTDQKGDFRIGPGLTVVRSTGTIEGDDFNRSLFAVMTPYILSIEGV